MAPQVWCLPAQELAAYFGTDQSLRAKDWCCRCNVDRSLAHDQLVDFEYFECHSCTYLCWWHTPAPPAPLAAGTGKTVLARAVAAAAGARLFVINGPDVVSEYYGESEKGLRGVFAAAKGLAPAVSRGREHVDMGAGTLCRLLPALLWREMVFW